MWADLVALVTAPDRLAAALARAQGGHWVAQELQARLTAARAARGQVARQGQRLLAAYLDGVVERAEFARTKQELRRRDEQLRAQQSQREADAQQQRDLAGVATGIAAFCAAVQVELLIDRVIVTDTDVEIRYAIPTSRDGPHLPFCLLRTDYLRLIPPALAVRMGLGRAARSPLALHAALHDAPTHQEGRVRQAGLCAARQRRPVTRQVAGDQPGSGRICHL